MAPGQEGSNSKWSVVKEWSGGKGVEHKPEPFTRPAAHSWRIAYRTEVETNVGGVVDFVVFTQDHKVIASVYNLQGKVSGSLTVTGDETEYYLELKSYGPNWWVAVEQPQ